ncbi:hypothetical protein [Bradyrhizobium sp. AT1]|uniref:hypothetical protein n=1 Tax=Bradyrhizobium sp. AT1 TaxID=574934 RepID=UPI001FD8A371|nr:hypothetical protein [Bradyrhizobium sp. AT1]
MRRHDLVDETAAMQEHDVVAAFMARRRRGVIDRPAAHPGQDRLDAATEPGRLERGRLQGELLHMRLHGFGRGELLLVRKLSQQQVEGAALQARRGIAAPRSAHLRTKLQGRHKPRDAHGQFSTWLGIIWRPEGLPKGRHGRI